jgi:nucleoside-diphosphate-sugar epimerase
MKRKVLITGAAGRIGTFLTNQWRDRYDLVLTDVRNPDHTHNFPFTHAELSDFAAIRQLCTGIDTLVHLGADPRMEAPWETLLPSNVIGTYNVFEGAHQAGCRRVVFASSINAVFGYPAEQQVNTDMPVNPINLYGATKCWGEALGRYYANAHKLSSICLRFGAVSYRPGQDPHYDNRYDVSHPYIDIILTMEDLTQLVTRSIEAPDDLLYGVFHGISNNRWKRLDLSDTRALLGYTPEDDAFALAGVGQS